MVRTPSESYQSSREKHPPVDDPEMWKQILNLFYWFERDEEYRWLKAVEAAVCTKEGKPTKPRGRVG